MTLRAILGIGMLAASAFVSMEARAADVLAGSADTTADGEKYWALQVTPYLWAAGINGDISPFRRAPTIGVDKSFSDVMNDLNIGGFINVWGRYDRFVFSADAMYVDTTDEKATGPLPPLPPPLPQVPSISGSVDTKEFTSTLQAGYRVYDSPAFTLDALGGVRFWHISNRVTVQAAGLSGSYKESFGWADPVVGARAFLRMTDKLSAQVQADVGGFNVGSKTTWQVLATANYIINDHLSVSGGYKVLSVDYESGGHVFDTRLSGPVLGVTWRF
ncbi:hypothetical protein [Mesorhizobium sp. NZP2234]|uniref:hypothetical protein n=1 Tax=Mesorhizobium sp. NZP2234 TaxID=2483402 RepID=UPI001FEFCE3B|nr:hypothetical protein [Mesorhizobium sp. NZP2234]